MENEKENEFKSIDVEESAPEQTFSETPSDGSMIAEGQSGEVYDYSKAPTTVKAPPRIDMNDKEVIIKKAEIKLPPAERDWVTAKVNKDVQYKYCSFILYYDYEGQQEFVSGLRVFKRDGDKYSHPSLMTDGKNQASQLLKLYADFKKKDIKEIALPEFMGYLNSQPKVRIKTQEVENPSNNKIVVKNLVGEFLPE